MKVAACNLNEDFKNTLGGFIWNSKHYCYTAHIYNLKKRVHFSTGR